MFDNMPRGVSFRTAPKRRKSQMRKIRALSAVLAALCMTLLLGTTIASPPAEARSTTYNLDIPSQSLKDALQALALASQHKLLYSADLVEGRKSQSSRGNSQPKERLSCCFRGRISSMRLLRRDSC